MNKSQGAECSIFHSFSTFFEKPKSNYFACSLRPGFNPSLSHTKD